MREFVKRSSTAPAGYFAWEAAGLRWLADAHGAPVVGVLDVSDDSLTLQRLDSARPTSASAREFGAGLARTHNAGASAFGVGPDDYTGPGFFGPLERPLEMTLQAWPSYGEFYAARIEQMLDHCPNPAAFRSGVRKVSDRLRGGDFDDTAGDPARVHGDLWSGNLMWTDRGGVLIDPAAHGGHHESDLAMLHLFGAPHLDAIIEGYAAVRPLADGWRERIALHQIYPLLAHVALFGEGYAAQTHRALERALLAPAR
ncbi:phosphotransferase [Epidermidibacterium keratini]|uniref:Phosphotransferase n=1 Tax=Epidermidibacterium keratini TaxID=1891644 RepID=A0A7L4YNB4_9ACTN|nr:fructosamine kinase family protein [Epidermidibacterium keratini]QHC00781.1 phosphotransferase [Epidermidibacterium keratini]